MRKRTLIGGISAVLLLFSAIGSGGDSQPVTIDTVQSTKSTPTSKTIPEKVIPTCDGTVVTSQCKIDGATYKTYVYHPAVPEKTHNETVTTYKEEIANYCTLCMDGTFSPSCATGRGACSHHGGVAEWNAPRYRTVPVNTTKTVVDAPAKEAYYEKILSE